MSNSDEDSLTYCTFTHRYYGESIEINGPLTKEGFRYVRTLQALADEENTLLGAGINAQLKKTFKKLEEPVFLSILICLVLLGCFVAKLSFKILRKESVTSLAQAMNITGILASVECIIVKLILDRATATRVEFMLFLISLLAFLVSFSMSVEGVSITVCLFATQGVSALSCILVSIQRHLIADKKTFNIEDNKQSYPIISFKLSVNLLIIMWSVFIMVALVDNALKNHDVFQFDVTMGEEMLVNGIAAAVIIILKLINFFRFSQPLLMTFLFRESGQNEEAKKALPADANKEEDGEDDQGNEEESEDKPTPGNGMQEQPEKVSGKQRHADNKSSLGKKSKDDSPKEEDAINDFFNLLRRGSSQQKNPNEPDSQDGIMEQEDSFDMEKEGAPFTQISPTTRMVTFAFVIFVIGGITFGAILEFMKGDYYNQMIYLIPLLKLVLFLTTCQGIEVQIGQSLVWSMYPIVLFISDLLVNGLALILMIKSDMFVSNGLTVASLIFNGLLPLVTVRVITSIIRHTYTTLNFNYRVYLLLFFLLPASLREICIILADYNDTLGRAFRISCESLTIGALIVTMIVTNWDHAKDIYSEIMVAKQAPNTKLYLMERLKYIEDHFYISSRTYFFVSVGLLAGYKHLIPSNLEYMMPFYYSIYAFLFYLHFLLSLLHIDFGRENSTKVDFTIKPFPILVTCVAAGLLVVATQIKRMQQYVESFILLFAMVAISNILIEISRYAISNSKVYRVLVKSVVLNIIYLGLVFPFLLVPLIGYIAQQANDRFLEVYATGGFFYISACSTLIGLIIHYVLNLSAINQKDLFLTEFMSEKLMSINTKDDPSIMITIARTYQILNKNPQELFNQLKKQHIARVTTHYEQSVLHDYSLDQPLEEATRKKVPDIIKLLVREKIPEIPPDVVVKPVLEDQSAQDLTKIINKKDLYSIAEEPHEKNQQDRLENKHLHELNRLFYAYFNCKGVFPQPPPQIKKQVLESPPEEILHRFYCFLSDPLDQIKEETFIRIMRLLDESKVDRRYEKIQRAYSELKTGNTFGEMSWKDFVSDYMECILGPKSTQVERNKVFVEGILLPMLAYSNEYFRYYMLRKLIPYGQNERMLWNNEIEDPCKEVFNLYKYRQQKKKMDVLVPATDDSKKKNRKRWNRKAAIRRQDVKKLHQKKIGEQEIPKVLMKNIEFKTTDQIYFQITEWLVECFNVYETVESENFKVTRISLRLSNIIALITKVVDFISIYILPPILNLQAYYLNEFSPPTYYFSLISYKILIFFVLFSAVLYFCLIVYHRQDFEKGKLGVDDMERTLSLGNIKYYTTFLLFIMGSSLATVILNVSLSAYICDQQAKLENFPKEQCYNSLHFTYMAIGLITVMSYYPISLITFPFSSFADRGLQIKYKSEYEVVYIQFKFMMIGASVLITSLDPSAQYFILSLCRLGAGLVLFFIFFRLSPCSFDSVNAIEDKVLVVVILINFPVILNYFFTFKVSCIAAGIVSLLTLAFIGYMHCRYSVRIYPKNEEILDAFEENIQSKVARQGNQLMLMKKRKQSGKSDGNFISMLNSLANKKKLSENQLAGRDSEMINSQMLGSQAQGSQVLGSQVLGSQRSEVQAVSHNQS